MPKEEAENNPPNEGISIASSGNTNITYGGTASGIVNNFTTIINVLSKKKEKKRQPRNVYSKLYDLQTTKDRKDQKKAIPNDSTAIQRELILEHFWKYLSINDKKNLTLVNKRINNIISAIDGFSLKIVFFFGERSFVPILTRDYKTVKVWYCHFSYLDSSLLKMFEHLSKSVKQLKLDNIKTNIGTLMEFLCSLPLLETLDLNILNLRDKGSLENLPKFLNLRHLNISSSFSNFNKVIDIFACASNIQSLSLYRMDIKMNALNNFCKRNKNSLNSLTIVRCELIPDSIQSNDLSIFDSLPKLRTLYLEFTNELTLSILTSKSFYWLTNIQLIYNSGEIEKFDSFLQNYFKQKEINELQLLEYEAKKYKEPIITKTKCPNSENMITTFYHVHHCYSKFEYNHKTCDRISLTNSELGNKINRISKVNGSLLQIQVRENKEDIQNVT